MGALKVIKALEEHTYLKDINRRVRKVIKNCHICQLVKCNNDKKKGVMQPITSANKLERVFLDICGPMPRSGGRKQYKFIVIIMDHYTKFVKLYPINRATTNKVLNIITQRYIPELGIPTIIITDHGTQFRGRKWKETLLDLGVRTYKTYIYHPNSNPVERVLHEVGRILRTYCHDQQRKWSEYIEATESFINLAYHESIRDTLYTCLLYTSISNV